MAANNVGTVQPYVIDVAHWPSDELFYNYPEGARSKTAVFRPEQLELDFIKEKRRYLYKRSDKRYPDQFWGEIVAYHIGCLLGVNVPPAYAAINSNEGDCAALIEWFYEDGKAVFDAGGVFMQRLIPDFDRKRGLQHNFATVLDIGRRFTEAGWLKKPWLPSWSEVFIFDALIGNTDRHQDNWGLLLASSVAGQKKYRAELSPLFDNGTSLGHERWPERLETWGEQRFAKYIRDGRHHMRWAAGDGASISHIDGLKEFCWRYPDLAPSLRSKILTFDLNALVEILDQLSALDVPIALTPPRKNLYIKLIALRKRSIELALQ